MNFKAPKLKYNSNRVMKSYNEDIGDHLKGVWREKQCGMLQPMCQQSLCATPVCGGT